MSVILLTARGETSIASRLEIGADDYLPKPFNSRELTPHSRVLRRLQPRDKVNSEVYAAVSTRPADPIRRRIHGIGFRRQHNSEMASLEQPVQRYAATFTIGLAAA